MGEKEDEQKEAEAVESQKYYNEDRKKVGQVDLMEDN